MTDTTAMRAELSEHFAARIEILTAAIAADQGGYILGWPQYSLGVLFANGNGHAVGAELATITTANDGRVVYNGANERAVPMRRLTALEAALKATRDGLALIQKQGA